MTGADILDVARDTVWVFLKLGAPLMLVALGVGLVISLFQALTQIQEQTLIFVPKIVAVFGVMILAMPFFGDVLSSYMARVAARIVSGG
jgi:flagellar biosynthesis protein FliQ